MYTPLSSCILMPKVMLFWLCRQSWEICHSGRLTQSRPVAHRLTLVAHQNIHRIASGSESCPRATLHPRNGSQNLIGFITFSCQLTHVSHVLKLWWSLLSIFYSLLLVWFSPKWIICCNLQYIISAIHVIARALKSAPNRSCTLCAFMAYQTRIFASSATRHCMEGWILASTVPSWSVGHVKYCPLPLSLKTVSKHK